MYSTPLYAVFGRVCLAMAGVVAIGLAPACADFAVKDDENVLVVIDCDDDDTDRYFQVLKDPSQCSPLTGGTQLMKLQENGFLKLGDDGSQEGHLNVYGGPGRDDEFATLVYNTLLLRRVDGPCYVGCGDSNVQSDLRFRVHDGNGHQTVCTMKKGTEEVEFPAFVNVGDPQSVNYAQSAGQIGANQLYLNSTTYLDGSSPGEISVVSGGDPLYMNLRSHVITSTESRDNETSEEVVASYTIPSGSWSDGKVFTFRVSGSTYKSGSTGSVGVRMRLVEDTEEPEEEESILIHNFTAVCGSQGTCEWTMEGSITCRSFNSGTGIADLALSGENHCEGGCGSTYLATAQVSTAEHVTDMNHLVVTYVPNSTSDQTDVYEFIVWGS